jgi:hypothetical protein
LTDEKDNEMKSLNVRTAYVVIAIGAALVLLILLVRYMYFNDVLQPYVWAPGDRLVIVTNGHEHVVDDELAERAYNHFRSAPRQWVAAKGVGRLAFKRGERVVYEAGITGDGCIYINGSRFAGFEELTVAIQDIYDSCVVRGSCDSPRGEDAK